jgi:hypothetical protein
MRKTSRHGAAATFPATRRAGHRPPIGVSAALVAVCASLALAVTEFVPPNDPAGPVFTTHSNDGRGVGRGSGFQVSSAQPISSAISSAICPAICPVGLFQDLTGIDLCFGLSEISAPAGAFSRDATLRTGGSNVTASGLEWVCSAVAPLTVSPGPNCLIEFAFNGALNHNFFYDNASLAWAQGPWTDPEGTQADGLSNFVGAAFRVDDAIPPPVPVPASLPLAVSGLAIVAGLGLRRRRGGPGSRPTRGPRRRWTETRWAPSRAAARARSRTA